MKLYSAYKKGVPLNSRYSETQETMKQELKLFGRKKDVVQHSSSRQAIPINMPFRIILLSYVISSPKLILHYITIINHEQ